MIIALGESVVVIGVGAAGLDLDAGLVVVALLVLALSAALWWLYFSDEGRVERALAEAPAEQHPYLAVEGFGLWHLGLLLGVVALAAGLKKATGAPYDPLDGWIATELACGVALFAASDVGLQEDAWVPRGGLRLVAAALALVTIPLGTETRAIWQVGALAAIVSVAIAAEEAPLGGGGSAVAPSRLNSAGCGRRRTTSTSFSRFQSIQVRISSSENTSPAWNSWSASSASRASDSDGAAGPGGVSCAIDLRDDRPTPLLAGSP